MKYVDEWRMERVNFVSSKTLEYIDKALVYKVLEIGPEGSTSQEIKNMFLNRKTLGYNPKIQTAGYTYPDSNTDYDIDISDAHTVNNLQLHNSFDIIYCLDVLEHVNYPWIAAENITNLLVNGGLAFISVPSFLD